MSSAAFSIVSDLSFLMNIVLDVSPQSRPIIRGKNLRFQYGDMHIAATVKFIWIYGKIMKNA